MKHLRTTVRPVLHRGFLLLLALCIWSGVGVAQTCVPPPPGLISWWPGDGNANDIEGGNDGVLTNGATFDSGLVDQAFRFNTSLNSGVRIASSASLNPTGVSHSTLGYSLLVFQTVLRPFFGGRVMQAARSTSLP